MARNITVGIDIGTYQVKVVVAEKIKGEDGSHPRVLGTGYAESRGLRHGYIVNIPEVTKSVAIALSQASRSAKVPIKEAYLSVGGIGLSGIISQGTALISRGDSEITDFDLEKALEASEQEIPKNLSQNRQIIHRIPIQYKIDGKSALGNPLGMKGMKVEVRSLFVTCLDHHYKDLIEAVEETGVGVIDTIASPIAAGYVTLTKAQKIAGCVLANIGSETISLVVFENDIPISLEVFPIGSTDITNDIALGLRVPLEEAESIKLGSLTSTNYPKKKLEEIVGARLSDMFELIDAHLKKIGKDGLLPAGIIITGGGASIIDIEDFAKQSLRLPSKIAHITFPEKDKGRFNESLFAVAYGLCILGLHRDPGDASFSTMMKNRKNILEPVRDWVKQFLP